LTPFFHIKALRLFNPDNFSNFVAPKNNPKRLVCEAVCRVKNVFERVLNIVRVVRINLNPNFMTDPIADYLTRLRNAIKASHRVVEIPASNLKKEITKILFSKGYILNYKFIEEGPQGTIKIALKYDPINKVNAIKQLVRISSPGLRQYVGHKELPRVLNGLGIAILSTSKGVMTDKEARDMNVGGEVLCYVY
jgi:small subunit ribosomal protein S8